MLLLQKFPANEAVLYDSGRSALVAALVESGVKEGDEVIINNNSCPAVADSIISTNATPVLAKCNEQGCIDMDSLDQIITARTKAIILTHSYGLLDQEPVLEGSDIEIINDLAQCDLTDPAVIATITKYKLSILSFGPEKYFSGLGGGVLLNNYTSRPTLPSGVSRVAQLKQSWAFCVQRYRYVLTFFLYSLKIPGVLSLTSSIRLSLQFKSKKSPHDISKPEAIEPKSYNSFLLLSLWYRLHRINRDMNAERNYVLLKRLLPDILISPILLNQTLPLQAVIKVPPHGRQRLAEQLSKQGFQTVWNYFPLSYYTAYSNFPSQVSNFWENVLTIPFRSLSSSQIHKLAKIINDEVIPNSANSQSLSN